MSVIQTTHLTKDFGYNRGIFDVDLNVEQGQCYGFLGPNGAGKSTTIRHLMGFYKPQSGSAQILGMDCFQKAKEIKKHVGYLPGEIAFPKGMKGQEFLNFMQDLRRCKNKEWEKYLLSTFELDSNQRIEDMSLGVRRKLAVVTAFAHDPDILILDEPTSGLDPLMQQVFIDFIISEKKRGKTILLSSHIFHEVDASCDKISIIKEGHIVADFDSGTLNNRDINIYKIVFQSFKDYESFTHADFQITHKIPQHYSCHVRIKGNEINKLLQVLKPLQIQNFYEIPYTLEDFFMEFYEKETTI